MKALIYTAVRQLHLRDAPDPVPGPEDALIRIEAAGICGSDVHAWAGHDERRPAPLILGHEVAGTVIAGPMAGQRVTINPLVTCGCCRFCRAGRDNLCTTRQIISMPPREGGFAEYLAIPARNLVAIPDRVSSQQASLAEPLACGWHAVRLGAAALDLSVDQARCLVIGGGAIGLGAALVLRAMGAGNISLSEPSPPRRAIAAKQDGIETLDPSVALPKDVDLVIDGVGYGATRSAASAALRPGGVLVHIGLGDTGPGLDIRRATLQELSFIGTYTYTAADFREAAAAMFDGKLGALDWAQAVPLADGADAFARIAAGQVAAPKVTLIP